MTDKHIPNLPRHSRWGVATLGTCGIQFALRSHCSTKRYAGLAPPRTGDGSLLPSVGSRATEREHPTTPAAASGQWHLRKVPLQV
eukprot:7578721-Alexandrium_andersonii.AAC.1